MLHSFKAILLANEVGAQSLKI